MLFLCMSVAGLIPTIVCMVMFKICNEDFNFETGRMLILISVAFYLLPFQIIKFLLPTSMANHIDISVHMDYFDGYEKSFVLSIGKNDYWIPNVIAVLGIIWMVVIIAFTLIQFALYEYRICVLKQNSKKQIIHLEDMGKQNVLVTEGVTSPYTIGFIRPFIVIPEKLLEDKSLNMIYRHEYYHLKKKDSLIKLLCLVTFCIHWYNPFTLINLFLYERFAEVLADKYAVNSCTDMQKKEYIKIMIQLASGRDKMPIVWKNTFFTTKKKIEWRMLIIMKKKSKKKIIPSIIAFVISIICSSTTIFAYTPFQISSGTKDVINSEEGYLKFDQKSVNSTDFSLTSNIFVSEDGEVYNIQDINHDERVLCIHDFAWGELSSHVPNSSGGCTMYVYEAKKCKKCNYLVVYDLLYTATYNPCIHK